MIRLRAFALMATAWFPSIAQGQEGRIGTLEVTALDTRGLVVEQSARSVIRDSASWLRLWQTSGKGGAQPSVVDFSRSTVIVVARGWTSSTGYALKVDSVVEYADRVNIHVKAVIPGPCPPQFVANYPQTLVLVPARAKPVYFRERTEAACPPNWGN